MQFWYVSLFLAGNSTLEFEMMTGQRNVLLFVDLPVFSNFHAMQDVLGS